MNTPMVREVVDAIRSLKNDKAVGIDAIHAEMLKVACQYLLESFSPFTIKCVTEKKYLKIGGMV